MDDITIQWLCNVPSSAGRVMGCCAYRDRIILACENGVYELRIDEIRCNARMAPVSFGGNSPSVRL